jgi:hypothetical protein
VCSALAVSGSVVPPSGDWYTQCSPMGFNNSILSAFCGLTFSNGTARLSVLNTTDCASDEGVKAVNGVLACSSAATFLPPGTWLDGCTVQTYDRYGFLEANCGAPNGTRSMINYNLCAPGASLSLSGYRLICSAPRAGLPGEPSSQVIV